MVFCYLKFLGSPSILTPQGYVVPSRQKSIAILSYLALTERNISRVELASLFWPDSTESKALGSLRTTLADINGIISHCIFCKSKYFLQIDDRITDCDVIQFRKKTAKNATLKEMKKAETLWSGSFLSGFDLKKNNRFSDWKDLQQNSLEQEYRTLLRKIALETLLLNNIDESLYYRKKLLVLDPYNEENHRGIMTLYNLSGDKAAADKQYKLCRKYIEDDLGFPLEEVTEKLYSDIINREKSALKHSSLKCVNELTRLIILPIAVKETQTAEYHIFSKMATETIIDICSRQKNLEILSSAAINSSSKKILSLFRIASELKADYIVEGSINLSEDFLYLEVRLLSAFKDTVIYSGYADCFLSGKSVVQGARKLTYSILRSLKFSHQSLKEIKDDPGLHWRLHGFSLLREYDPDLQRLGIKSFIRALELNGNDAAAWSGVGLAKLSLCHFGLYGADTEHLFREAEEAADKALALDPGEAMALYIKGWLAEDYYWNIQEAGQYYKQAIEEDPTNSQALVGQFSLLLRKKRLEEAMNVLEKINHLNPCCGMSITAKFWGLVATRQYRKAFRILNEVHPFFQSECLGGSFKALMQLLLKNYKEAARIMEENAASLIKEDKKNLLFIQAYAYGAENLRKQAMDVISLMKKERSSLRGISVPIAAIHTLWGEYEIAMDLVEEAVITRDTCVYFLIYLPFYDPLFSFSRFRNLMKRANFGAWVL